MLDSAQRSGDQIAASVGPQLVPPSSPLYGIMNSSTGLTFRTDVLPDSVSARGSTGGRSL